MKNKKLQEVHEEACVKISKSLAKLTNKHAVVDIVNPGIEEVNGLTLPIGPDEVVAGVCLPVSGEVKGAALLLFPQQTAFDLSDLLIKREPGTTKELTELDKSALEELGNIVCGNYFANLSNETKVKIIEHIPQFNLDTFGTILSQTKAEFAQKTQKVLTIEIEFNFAVLSLKGYFLLVFETEQFQTILDALESSKSEALKAFL